MPTIEPATRRRAARRVPPAPPAPSPRGGLPRTPWIVAWALLLAGAALASTQADPPTPTPTPTPAPPAAATATPAAAQDGGTAPAEQGVAADREPWVKRLRRWTHRTVVGSAAWFDGLFGDERIDDDVYVSRAWLTGFASWDEEDGVSPGLRLRARFVFPQMERKLGLLIGRGDADDRLSETDPGSSGLDRLPGSESDTVAGLEYVPLQGTGSRLSFSAGARIADPLDPYVRGRFRHLMPIGDDALVRFRQTVFWRDSIGFGTTSAVDVERRRARGFLVRWTNALTVSEASAEVEYDVGLTVYHALGERSALAWHSWVTGDSGFEVPTREYGIDLAFRRRLNWWWLIGEVRAGRAWRRELLADDRHGVWLAGVGVEMQLGPTP